MRKEFGVLHTHIQVLYQPLSIPDRERNCGTKMSKSEPPPPHLNAGWRTIKRQRRRNSNLKANYRIGANLEQIPLSAPLLPEQIKLAWSKWNMEKSFPVPLSWLSHSCPTLSLCELLAGTFRTIAPELSKTLGSKSLQKNS